MFCLVRSGLNCSISGWCNFFGGLEGFCFGLFVVLGFVGCFVIFLFVWFVGAFLCLSFLGLFLLFCILGLFLALSCRFDGFFTSSKLL